MKNSRPTSRLPFLPSQNRIVNQNPSKKNHQPNTPPPPPNHKPAQTAKKPPSPATTIPPLPSQDYSALSKNLSPLLVASSPTKVTLVLQLPKTASNPSPHLNLASLHPVSPRTSTNPRAQVARKAAVLSMSAPALSAMAAEPPPKRT
jgi:hypothetical protein